jgi:hypothetical protein
MAKCSNCKKKTNVVFDGRLTDSECRIFAVLENGKKPKPTGLCKECFKKQICSDIDSMEQKLK